MRQFSILCSIFVLIYGFGNLTVLAQAGMIPFFSGMSLSGSVGNVETGTVHTGTLHTGSLTPIVKKKNPLRFTFVRKNLPILSSGDDTSMFRFVSKNVSLSDTQYEATDLVRITHPSINEAGRSSKLRSEAARSLWKMATEFEKKFQTPFVVISGYRSAAYQQRMWDLGRCNSTLCAPPGYSEHQLGLAIDVFDASTEMEYYKNPTYLSYVNWLKENAHLYGWTQSYQKGVDIDNYEVEPWHWRYIGVEMATRLKNLGWTYTEYIRFNESISWLR